MLKNILFKNQWCIPLRHGNVSDATFQHVDPDQCTHKIGLRFYKDATGLKLGMHNSLSTPIFLLLTLRQRCAYKLRRYADIGELPR